MGWDPERRDGASDARPFALLVGRSQAHLDALRVAVEASSCLDLAGAAPSVEDAGDTALLLAERVVVQVVGPGSDAAAEVTAARRLLPHAHVVVVSDYVDDQLADILTKRGASAVVSTDVALDTVLTVVADPNLAGPQHWSEQARVSTVATELGITTRELQVLHLLSEGRTPQQIAREFMVSLDTVRDHIKQAKQKLECSTAVQLVVTAHRAGLLPSLGHPVSS